MNNQGMVLIRRYRLRAAGKRGHSITIPAEYVEGIAIKNGQKFAMFRDGDSLVLVPEREART